MSTSFANPSWELHPPAQAFCIGVNGRRCVLIAINREGNQNAIQIAEDVRQFMEDYDYKLPEGVSIGYWSDMSRIVKGRLDTLYDSALKSVLLVFLVLTLFLRPSLAFWVVIGIPICFLVPLI